MLRLLFGSLLELYLGSSRIFLEIDQCLTMFFKERMICSPKHTISKNMRVASKFTDNDVSSTWRIDLIKSILEFNFCCLEIIFILYHQVVILSSFSVMNSSLLTFLATYLKKEKNTYSQKKKKVEIWWLDKCTKHSDISSFLTSKNSEPIEDKFL
jgi:hypothetical protein